jgi:phosphate/sulfate permease
LEQFQLLWNAVKSHVSKGVIVFVLGGIAAVLGLVPGTGNVSNIVGNQITNIKTDLGTTASSTVVH